MAPAVHLITPAAVPAGLRRTIMATGVRLLAAATPEAILPAAQVLLPLLPAAVRV